MEHADSAAKLEVVLALDPADRIIQLIYVVCKFRIATVVQLLLVTERAGGKFNAWEGGALHPRESDLRRVSLPEAVGDFTAEPAAKSDQELVDDRRPENVIVTETRIPSILRQARPKDGCQAGNTARLRVVVVEATGDPLLLRDYVINLDIK